MFILHILKYTLLYARLADAWFWSVIVVDSKVRAMTVPGHEWSVTVSTFCSPSGRLHSETCHPANASNSAKVAI